MRTNRPVRGDGRPNWTLPVDSTEPERPTKLSLPRPGQLRSEKWSFAANCWPGDWTIAPVRKGGASGLMAGTTIQLPERSSGKADVGAGAEMMTLWQPTGTRQRRARSAKGRVGFGVRVGRRVSWCWKWVLAVRR